MSPVEQTMSRVTLWCIAAAVIGVAVAPAALGASDEWQLLGTQRVEPNAQHGVIGATGGEGRFNAIRIEVTEGTLEMFNIRVVFANGEAFSPDTRQVFREGQRSRVIDIPGEARMIRRIEFAYRNADPRGVAIVRVFGRKAEVGGENVGGNQGWDRIGSREVDFVRDHDVIPAAFEGAFRSIEIGVQGGDVEMYNVKVKFANGESFSPDTRLRFEGNTRSRVIDLPGTLRVIRSIEFTYRSLRGEGKATVTVYGRK